jgi:hypothetical protein
MLHQILHITMAMRCWFILEQNGTILQRFWLFTANSRPLPTRSRILTNSLGKRKVCAKWIPHVLNDNQRAMCVLATTHLQRWRNEGNAFLDRILMVEKSWIHSFDTQLKSQNAEWGAPTSPRKKIARRSQSALEVKHVMFFSRNGLVLDHPMPVRTTVSGPYYCSLLQDKVRKALCRKQPELLERCAILLQDNAKPHHHCDMQNLVQCWGWEVLHILPTLQISPHVIIGCFHI